MCTLRTRIKCYNIECLTPYYVGINVFLFTSMDVGRIKMVCGVHFFADNGKIIIQRSSLWCVCVCACIPGVHPSNEHRGCLSPIKRRFSVTFRNNGWTSYLIPRWPIYERKRDKFPLLAGDDKAATRYVSNAYEPFTREQKNAFTRARAPQRKGIL